MGVCVHAFPDGRVCGLGLGFEIWILDLVVVSVLYGCGVNYCGWGQVQVDEMYIGFLCVFVRAHLQECVMAYGLSMRMGFVAALLIVILLRIHCNIIRGLLLAR